MEILQSLKWSCIETSEGQSSSRRIILTENEYPSEHLAIGEHIDTGTHRGCLIASSWMGITIFDLFNEIITPDDMTKFLKQKGSYEQSKSG